MIIHDLHNLSWRAFHTTGALTNGIDNTGVIFGVLREIQGMMRIFPDPLIIIATDSKKSLRRDIFPGYKNNRSNTKDTPEEKEARADCIRQINLLKSDVFPAIGLRNVFEYDGFEADDIMAEIAIRKSKWVKPTIVTGDEDLYQMLPFADIWSPNKKKKITESRFFDIYGISPRKWAEYKALAGCSSDTVPGVAGVGPKYAMDHINGELKAGKKLDAIKMAESNGHLELMRKLVTLPFPGTPVSSLRPIRFNRDGFLDICERFAFETLAEDVEEWEDNFNKPVK